MSDLTTQEVEQFEESRAKVRSVGKAVIGQSQYVEKAISFYEHVQFNVEQVFTAALNASPPAQCKPGCSYCCRGKKIEVTLPEALYITEAIKQLPEERQRNIRERLEQSTKIIEKGEPIKSCSFLENDLCLIYDVRPSACRKAHSQSVKACQQNKEIPQQLATVLAAEAIMLGTQDAYEALGYIAEVLELNMAIHGALNNQSMMADWYKVHLESMK